MLEFGLAIRVVLLYNKYSVSLYASGTQRTVGSVVVRPADSEKTPGSLPVIICRYGPKIQKTPEVQKMNYTVVSGEEMAAYFQVNRPECTDIIPFNGQMDIGSPKEDLLSGMFIVERLSAWHTTITNYQDKILKYLDAFREPEGNTYHLYFEDSARSYANILTILAYLDRAGYRKPVEVTFTSPDYRDRETRKVKLAGMFNRYKEYCRSGNNTEMVRELLYSDAILARTPSENAEQPQQPEMATADAVSPAENG